MLNLEQIIRSDFERHHQGREYTIDQAVKAYQKYVALGLPVIVANNVALNYKDLGDRVVEFHCMNAGTGIDLTKSINDFLKSVSDVYDRAVTYYDNPRINDLVRYSYFPAKVTRVDGGLDRTYELSFDLRGM